MSELVRIFNESVKTRVVEAREIPEREVNYIDRQNVFQQQFNNFQEARKTTYTDKALQFYNEERSTMVVPESWRPIEVGIQLHRWQPENGYFQPGQPQG